MDRAWSVGKGNRAGFQQQAHFGEMLAVQRLSQGGHGINIGDRGIPGPTTDEVNQRNIVNDWIRIGHDDEAGDTTGRCRFAGGGERFFMLGTRLTGEHSHVNETRTQNVSAAIDGLYI